MFGKLADKLNKRFQTPEEEITFKSYNDVAEEIEAQKNDALGSTLKADESEKDSSIKFKLVKPQSFEEVSKIADHLIEGCTVVLNTELLDPPTCRRMLDFLNGVTYTKEGEIKNVAPNTYIITPNGIDIRD